MNNEMITIEVPVKDNQYKQLKSHHLNAVRKPYALFTINEDKYRNSSVGILVHGSTEGKVHMGNDIFMTLEELVIFMDNKYKLTEKNISEVYVLCCHGATMQEHIYKNIHIYPMIKSPEEIQVLPAVSTNENGEYYTSLIISYYPY